MAHYEITAIVKGSTAADAAPGKEAIEGILSKHGVKIDKKEEWGHKKFWYPINKTPDGTYCFYSGEADGATIATIQHEAKLNQHIMRLLVIKFDPTKKKVVKREPKPAPTVTPAPQS